MVFYVRNIYYFASNTIFVYYINNIINLRRDKNLVKNFNFVLQSFSAIWIIIFKTRILKSK